MLKTTGDITAIGTAFLSFFKMVPWPEISAFLAAVYMVMRIYYVLKNKGKE